MGFEIHFNYFEKNAEGKGYNTEIQKTFKKHVGKLDEVALEELASVIMKQMARRDILVDEIQVFEFTKKSVPFKEIKGGISIKGQKFSLDSISLNEEICTSSPQPKIISAEEYSSVTKLRESPQIDSDNLQVLRMEIFDPASDTDDAEIVVSRLAARHISLKIGKRYPIFNETEKQINVRSEIGGTSNVLLMYKISDDNGKIFEVPSTYFRVEEKPLLFMDGVQHEQRTKVQEQPKLLYMNERQTSFNPTNDNGMVMPEIRRR